MALIKANISEDLETNFRKAAMQTYGYKKGSISHAIENALFEWTSSRKAFSKEIENTENSIDAMEGILIDVKMTSVELQKEALKWRAERYDRHRR